LAASAYLKLVYNAAAVHQEHSSVRRRLLQQSLMVVCKPKLMSCEFESLV